MSEPGQLQVWIDQRGLNENFAMIFRARSYDLCFQEDRVGPRCRRGRPEWAYESLMQRSKNLSIQSPRRRARGGWLGWTGRLPLLFSN